MKAYQILNSSGYPAGTIFNDLCIFPTKEDAKGYIRHLVYDCGIEKAEAKKFKIVQVKVIGGVR